MPGADGSNRASDRRKADCEHRQRKRGRVRDHLTAEEVERRRDDEESRRQRSSRRAAEASPDQPGAHGAETEDPDQHRPDARDARTCHDRCDAEQVVEPGELRREDVRAELLTVPERIDCGEIDALVEVRSVVKESALQEHLRRNDHHQQRGRGQFASPLPHRVTLRTSSSNCRYWATALSRLPCDSTYARPLRPISSRSSSPSSGGPDRGGEELRPARRHDDAAADLLHELRGLALARRPPTITGRPTARIP